MEVKWTIVYGAEAHATDEWPISSSRFNEDRGPVNIAQHKDTDERIAAAKMFVKDFVVDWCQVVVDAVPGPNVKDRKTLNNIASIENDGDFEQAYAPWPLRFYVIRNNKLVYIAYPQNCTYDVGELRRFVLGSLIRCGK